MLQSQTYSCLIYYIECLNASVIADYLVTVTSERESDCESDCEPHCGNAVESAFILATRKIATILAQFGRVLDFRSSSRGFKSLRWHWSAESRQKSVRVESHHGCSVTR